MVSIGIDGGTDNGGQRDVLDTTSTLNLRLFISRNRFFFVNSGIKIYMDGM